MSFSFYFLPEHNQVKNPYIILNTSEEATKDSKGDKYLDGRVTSKIRISGKKVDITVNPLINEEQIYIVKPVRITLIKSPPSPLEGKPKIPKRE
jgi:hypothetical protein